MSPWLRMDAASNSLPIDGSTSALVDDDAAMTPSPTPPHPSHAPTPEHPSSSPTEVPATPAPSTSATPAPSATPSSVPLPLPTYSPSPAPTSLPSTAFPSSTPTYAPTNTFIPTPAPSYSHAPTQEPTIDPQLTFVSCNTVSLMRLACVAEIALEQASIGGEQMRVTLRYFPRGDDSAALYTTESVIDGSASMWQIPLYRLRPLTEYVVQVYGRAKNVMGSEGLMYAHGSFTSSGIGISVLDNGPIALITGNYTPSYSVLVMDLNLHSDEFQGIVAVDNAGYIVWYHNAEDQVLAFDRFDGTTQAGDNAYALVINVIVGGSTSYLATIAPDGRTLSEVSTSCSGPGINWEQINHEARISSDQKSVLTVKQTVAKMPVNKKKLFFENTSVEYYIKDHVATWHLDSTDDGGSDDDLQMLYDVEKYVNPRDDRITAENSMTWLTDLSCDTDEISEALDWSHTSSIYPGRGLYIVSLRNVDTVMAFNQDGSGVAWILSSTLDNTNFTFSSTHDKFYDVHDAQLISHDELILMDDGNNRPGCKDNSASCFSRAIKYKLDFVHGTVKLIWQFEFGFEIDKSISYSEAARKDLWVFDGGSVSYDAQHGYYYPAFTVANGTEDGFAYGRYAWIFEVDENETIRSEIRVQKSYWDLDESGLYRAIPHSCIYGESAQSPFNVSVGHRSSR